MNEAKYHHPQEPSLTWSGKGRQPKWVEAFIAQGGTLDELADAAAHADQDTNEAHIDLGIGDVHPVVDTEVVSMNSRLADLAESVNALPRANQTHVRFDAPVADTLLEMSDGGNSDTLSDLVISPNFSDKIAVDLTASVESRWEEARRHEEIGKARFAALGLILLSLKKDVPHGEFLPELERRGFEERQARRAMAYANYVFTQSPKQQARLLEMPVTKVAALAGADPEVVETLMSDGDRVEKTNVRDLLDELKGYRQRELRLQDDLELARLQLERLQGEKRRLTDLLPRTEDVRAECLALQAGAEWHLNALRKLFDDTEETAPEGFLQVETVWITANVIAARALDLVQRIRDMGPVNLPERPHGEHCMQPAEAQAWLLNYPLIESRLSGEAASRQEKRDAMKPRGPGRPAGSKNKANGGV